MDFVTDFLKFLTPAVIVSYALYATVKAFLNKELLEKRQVSQQKNAEIAFPLRLQAYERLCLFLERITPNNLLVRLSGNSTSVMEFQQLLLREVREELYHNLSQQVYVSNEAWERVKASQQEVCSLINQASGEVQADAEPIELSKKIFEKIIQQNLQPTLETLRFLKQEIQREFI